MNLKLKLHVLLAKTEQSAGSFKKILEEYLQFFKDKQGSFKGTKKTYEPKPGTMDEPTMRGDTLVVTTVGEKLKYLEETTVDHINNVFSVEATNASGKAIAELLVDGFSFGTLSSLELLKLKSMLESGTLEGMYANIPVRSDSELWEPNTTEQYAGREIYQGSLFVGTKKSLNKVPYILDDPNLEKLKDQSSYKPQVQTRDTPIDLGDYTYQHFSGEYTQKQRAAILARRSKLLVAVTEALKIANEAEIKESSLTAEKIFGYLHNGKIV